MRTGSRALGRILVCRTVSFVRRINCTNNQVGEAEAIRNAIGIATSTPKRSALPPTQPQQPHPTITRHTCPHRSPARGSGWRDWPLCWGDRARPQEQGASSPPRGAWVRACIYACVYAPILIRTIRSISRFEPPNPSNFSILVLVVVISGRRRRLRLRPAGVAALRAPAQHPRLARHQVRHSIASDWDWRSTATHSPTYHIPTCTQTRNHTQAPALRSPVPQPHRGAAPRLLHHGARRTRRHRRRHRKSRGAAIHARLLSRHAGRV